MNDSPVVFLCTSVPPLSLENEKAAFGLIETICQYFSANFTKTLQEDKDFYEMNKETLSFNEQNIMKFKISEKELINFWFELCPSV